MNTPGMSQLGHFTQGRITLEPRLNFSHTSNGHCSVSEFLALHNTNPFWVILTNFKCLLTGLYYVDSLYEKVERVDLPDGSNAQILLDNTPDLRSLKVFYKRPGEMRDLSKWCTLFACMHHNSNQTFTSIAKSRFMVCSERSCFQSIFFCFLRHIVPTWNKCFFFSWRVSNATWLPIHLKEYVYFMELGRKKWYIGWLRCRSFLISLLYSSFTMHMYEEGNKVCFTE